MKEQFAILLDQLTDTLLMLQTADVNEMTQEEMTKYLAMVRANEKEFSHHAREMVDILRGWL